MDNEITKLERAYLQLIEENQKLKSDLHTALWIIACFMVFGFILAMGQ